jgi:hypothetical protein
MHTYQAALLFVTAGSPPVCRLDHTVTHTASPRPTFNTILPAHTQSHLLPKLHAPLLSHSPRDSQSCHSARLRDGYQAPPAC